jgi:hypothetical protein
VVGFLFKALVKSVPSFNLFFDLCPMTVAFFSFSILFSGSRGSRGFSGGYRRFPGSHTTTRGDDGLGYLNPDAAAFIAGICLLILGYIVYKVWRSLRDERKIKKRSKKEEEAAAFRDLYKDNFGDKEKEVDLFEPEKDFD